MNKYCYYLHHVKKNLELGWLWTLPNIFHKEIDKNQTRIGLKNCSNSSIFSKEK